MAFEAGPYLPEHILIAEVLHRLPVKTLVRFRCVSKTWHHVIGSSSFASTHLTYQKDSSEKHMLFESHYLCSLLTNPESIFDLRRISTRYITPDQSWASWSWRPYLFRGARVYGICNGLLCFSYKDYRIGDDILLWNPTCYKIKKLPEIDTDGVRFNLTASVSFGYHNEDYKVIVIAPILDKYVVFIYGLSTNSWNSVFPNFHHHIPFDTDDDKAIKYTGFVDCTAYMTTRFQLTCFDLSDEIVQVIDFPQELFICGAEAYGETVAIFASDLYVCPRSFSMWILKDRASSTSPWEKKFVFDMQGAVGLVGVGFLNNGEYVVKAFTDKEGMVKFFVCDFQSQKLLELGSVLGDNFPYVFGARIHSNYVESLLLLNEEGLTMTSLDFLKILPYYTYAKKDVSSTTQEQPASNLDFDEGASEFNLAKVEGTKEAELRQRGEQTTKQKDAMEKKVKYSDKSPSDGLQFDDSEE